MTLEQDQALVRAANECTHLPLTLLLDDSDYRIREVLGGWVLEYQDPAMLQWHEMADPGSLAYCHYAYEQLSEGESPLNFDDWQGEQEDCKEGTNR